LIDESAAVQVSAAIDGEMNPDTPDFQLARSEEQ